MDVTLIMIHGACRQNWQITSEDEITLRWRIDKMMISSEENSDKTDINEVFEKEGKEE